MPADGEGLHEVRTDLANNRVARALSYIDKQQRMVLLHGFIKKSRTTGRGPGTREGEKRKHERGLP